MNSLKKKYQSDVAPKLVEEFGIKSISATPKLEKVVVNMGVGNLSKNKEALKKIRADLATITGQAPSTRGARLSVASFSIREGAPVGLMTTLRGERMYSFLERLFSIALPRLRDFRGASLKSFDLHGNYSLGLPEHTVFPEIDTTKSAAPWGIEITMITNTKNVQQSKRLLELLGMPFEKEDIN